MSAQRFRFAAVVAAAVAMVAFSAGLAADDEKGEEKQAAAKDKAEWRPLFDGKTLTGWKTTQFGAHGEPEAKDGQLIIPTGDPLSGAHREKDDVPRVNYEVAFEAQRVEGSDFFVGLTFPVEKSYASLILGGWSGSVCGISSIDHMDASENSTSSFREFKNGRWYKVRLRVLKDRLEAWVDDEQIVDADIEGKKLSTRVEVEASKPFGFSTYRTTAALRNLRVRELKPEEVKAGKEGEAANDGKAAESDKSSDKP